MAINFDALAESAPGLNEQARERQRAAQDIMLQRQLGALPSQVNEKAAATQLATQSAAQAGQAITQQQQAAQQQALQMTGAQAQQQAQQEQLSQQRTAVGQDIHMQNLKQLKAEEAQTADLESRKRIQESEIEAEDMLSRYNIDQDNRLQMATIQQRRDLANLGNDIKDQIIDSRLRFEKDERGRKFSNERQLRDYAISNARSEQDLRSELDSMQRDTERYILTMEFAEKRMTQILNQGYLSQKGDLDRQSILKIQQIKKELQDKLNKKKRDAANQRMIVGGVIMAAGVAATVATGGAAAPIAMPVATAGASYATGGGQ
jgi:hypothetical protein